MTRAQTFAIDYHFTLPDGQQVTICMHLDAQTVLLVDDPGRTPPFWTELTFHQCPHCPLDPATEPHCPVALNLVTVYRAMGQLMSYEKVEVKVTTAQRVILAHRSAQEAIGSIMGVLIAASRCPHTHFLKPMARFHLPFADKEETIWRAVSTYLLARHFQPQAPADPDLQGLTQAYDAIATVNDALVMRLRAASEKDSLVNALVHLDVFAKFLTPPVEQSVRQIRRLFAAYLGWQDRQ